MPSKPIDYSKTVFYKIVCKDLNIIDCYVGHTTDFTKRKNSHKTRCLNINNKKHNIYLYQFIRENGGWDNWDMVYTESRTCRNSLEAKRIEREITENLKANLNVRKAFQAPDEKIEGKKIWRDNNPEYNKQYYQEHKEEHNARSKKYREENPGKMKEYKKKWYEKNKKNVN